MTDHSVSFWKSIKYVYCLTFGMLGIIQRVESKCVWVSYRTTWASYDLDGTSKSSYLSFDGDKQVLKKSKIVPISWKTSHILGKFYN